MSRNRASAKKAGTSFEALNCNATGIKHEAHTWDFGSGERFWCEGDPDGFDPTLEVGGGDG